MGWRLDCIDSEKLQRVRAIITDVDGVLSDGAISYTTSGEQLLRFDAQDGAGIKYWQRAGGKFALLTGRSSSMVARRALELDVDEIVMNAKEKLGFFDILLGRLGVSATEVLYIGDDWPDIPCMRRAGLGVAVANAVEEVVQEADWVTRRPGGYGAVREVITHLLRAQNKLDKLLERYK